MNPDVLMELVQKWRGEVTKMNAAPQEAGEAAEARHETHTRVLDRAANDLETLVRLLGR